MMMRGARFSRFSAMRLGKYLAHAGVASRRAAEGLIAAGRVRVDGVAITDPARDVGEDANVEVDGRAVRGPERRVVYALNKPVGVVSTARDTHGRETVVNLVHGPGVRLYPVGRLDADSSGLILLTNDGELANRLTHPRFEVPKTYRVTLAGALSERSLRRLRDGVELEDGPTGPVKVRRVRGAGGLQIEITIHEGRNREVRRMCEAVGQRVTALQRIAFGPLRLGTLAPGEHRLLGETEVARLRAL
jgi:23S rRNA pseudouridine2605 synthase